jgi:hypothetical protein
MFMLFGSSGRIANSALEAGELAEMGARCHPERICSLEHRPGAALCSGPVLRHAAAYGILGTSMEAM